MGNTYIANLAFLLNYNTGTTNDEIEYEIYKLAFQAKGSLHYDRNQGSFFEDLEQEKISDAQILAIQFSSALIESIYLLNQERNFNPYIVVGFSDIITEVYDTSMIVTIKYRLLQDLSVSGAVNMDI